MLTFDLIESFRTPNCCRFCFSSVWMVPAQQCRHWLCVNRWLVMWRTSTGQDDRTVRHKTQSINQFWNWNTFFIISQIEGRYWLRLDDFSIQEALTDWLTHPASLIHRLFLELPLLFSSSMTLQISCFMYFCSRLLTLLRLVPSTSFQRRRFFFNFANLWIYQEFIRITFKMSVIQFMRSEFIRIRFCNQIFHLLEK